MTARRLGAGAYVALKATTGAFVDSAFGHQKVAAGHTRVEQQAISDYCSTAPDKAAKFMPVDVLADLIDASGNTVLLKHLAERAGCLLVQLPHGIGNAVLTDRSGRTAQEFGEVMAGVLAALGDGRITRAEATGILKDIRELMIELAGMAEAVKAAVRDEEDEE